MSAAPSFESRIVPEEWEQITVEHAPRLQGAFRREARRGVGEPFLQQLADGGRCALEGAAVGLGDHGGQRSLRLPLAALDRLRDPPLAAGHNVAPDVHA
jgi:hypothetical protein